MISKLLSLSLTLPSRSFSLLETRETEEATSLLTSTEEGHELTVRKRGCIETCCLSQCLDLKCKRRCTVSEVSLSFASIIQILRTRPVSSSHSSTDQTFPGLVSPTAQSATHPPQKGKNASTFPTSHCFSDDLLGEHKALSAAFKLFGKNR